MRHLPRSAWNARPRRHHPGRLDPAEVVGLAFHWPGTKSTRPISKAAVPRALRSWQNFHMDGHGWSDIAYQVAVDQWGRVWNLRGLENRSAANGGTTENSRYGAVLLVLVQNEEPSPAMIAAVRVVVAEHRRLFPRSRKLAGHGEVRSGGWTDCPGPATRRQLRMGAFNPRNEGDDVTREELQAAIRNTRITLEGKPGSGDTREVRLEGVLRHLENEQDRIAKKLERVLELLEDGGKA